MRRAAWGALVVAGMACREAPPAQAPPRAVDSGGLGLPARDTNSSPPSGVAVVGPHARVTLGEVHADVDASPDGAQAVARILRQRMAFFRACYEMARSRGERFEGEARLVFSVDADGHAQRVTLDGVGDDAFRECVAARVRTVAFATPEQAPVAYTAPLTFSPPADASAPTQ